MEYEIDLRQDQICQLKRLTRMFLQQLQVIPEYKHELGDVSKGIKRFFQKYTWLYDSIPYSIDEKLDELEDADVCITISLDSPKEPIVNAGRVGREDIRCQQTNRRPFIPKEEYIKQQRETREHNRDHQKDCTCLACSYTTQELHKLLNGLHTGDPKTCSLRGPKNIRDKEVRERVNQYNLKHKEDKRAEVSDNRLNKPPQGPTLPKANHLNSKFDETSESDV